MVPIKEVDQIIYQILTGGYISFFQWALFIITFYWLLKSFLFFFLPKSEWLTIKALKLVLKERNFVAIQNIYNKGNRAKPANKKIVAKLLTESNLNSTDNDESQEHAQSVTAILLKVLLLSVIHWVSNSSQFILLDVLGILISVIIIIVFEILFLRNTGFMKLKSVLCDLNHL